jgi:hypothetical protein
MNHLLQLISNKFEDVTSKGESSQYNMSDIYESDDFESNMHRADSQPTTDTTLYMENKLIPPTTERYPYRANTRLSQMSGYKNIKTPDKRSIKNQISHNSGRQNNMQTLYSKPIQNRRRGHAAQQIFNNRNGMHSCQWQNPREAPFNKIGLQTRDRFVQPLPETNNVTFERSAPLTSFGNKNNVYYSDTPQRVQYFNRPRTVSGTQKGISKMNQQTNRPYKNTSRNTNYYGNTSIQNTPQFNQQIPSKFSTKTETLYVPFNMSSVGSEMKSNSSRNTRHTNHSKMNNNSVHRQTVQIPTKNNHQLQAKDQRNAMELNQNLYNTIQPTPAAVVQKIKNDLKLKKPINYANITAAPDRSLNTGVPTLTSTAEANQTTEYKVDRYQLIPARSLPTQKVTSEFWKKKRAPPIVFPSHVNIQNQDKSTAHLSRYNDKKFYKPELKNIW